MMLFLKKISPWVLIIAFAVTCYISQENKSVTVDEFSHFPSGLYNLKTFDWRMDFESPPLIKCLPVITTIITKPKMDENLFKDAPNPWSLGYHFMYSNYNKYVFIFRFARCSIILLGCLLGWLIYRFGTELYGWEGGILSLFLYVFNPNIIAHSRLTTIDIGASCSVFLSVYFFWIFLKKKNLFMAVLSGMALGLAQLSKFTALILYPIFFIIFTALTFGNLHWKKKHPIDSLRLKAILTLILKDIGYLLLIIIISILVINIGYLFSGTMTNFGEYSFQSEPLRRVSSLVWEGLPIPMPYDYIYGFDKQLAISEGNHPFYISYLMGKHSLTGWWYYYLIAFVIKNPIILTVILLCSVIIWLKSTNRTIIESSLCIWVTIIVFLLYFSIFTKIQIGIRFLLPIFPFLILACGCLVTNPFFKGKYGKYLYAGIIFAYLIPSFYVFPNYLSFFNFTIGGPKEGYKWLIDSNLDWGQDLPTLKEYIKRNKINKVKLGYFGRVDPGIYGIQYELPNRNLETGTYAISTNFLVGRPYYLLREDPKELLYVDLDFFKEYRKLQPRDVINNTLLIFEIHEKDLLQNVRD